MIDTNENKPGKKDIIMFVVARERAVCVVSLLIVGQRVYENGYKHATRAYR